MGTTYFITGGAGNLACQLSWELARRGDRTVLFDPSERPAAPVPDSCTYVRGDLTSPDELRAALRQSRPDWVLHFASLLSGQSEQDRALAWRVNMHGMFDLLEAMLELGIRRMFFPSSVASYGGELPDPLPEDWPQWPAGLYGATKVAAERLGVYYHARHGIDFRCIRVPIVISPFAATGAASAYASRAFIEAVHGGRFTFQVTTTTRAASIYAKDIVHAFLRTMDADAKQLTRRVYNIHALAPSAQELADAIVARVSGATIGFDPDPQIAALLESWPARIVDDSARADWGWAPRFADLSLLADDFVAELRRTRTCA